MSDPLTVLSGQPYWGGGSGEWGELRGFFWECKDKIHAAYAQLRKRNDNREPLTETVRDVLF